MGNLLSLYPKIHRLRADAKENCGFAHADGYFVDRSGKRYVDCCIHETLIKGMAEVLGY